MNVTKFCDWAAEKHAATNQLYDYLPYKYHLVQVEGVFRKFIYLVVDSGIDPHVFICSAFGHDLIEDARVNYKEIIKWAKICEATDEEATQIADIIAACTSYVQGKDRKARMPPWVYTAIRDTPGATFIKLCDRIANVTYSKETYSGMLNKYKEEYDHFKLCLYDDRYKPMFRHLESLF